MTLNDDNLAEALSKGGVAVMPTDTIYGIVGQAESETVVSRVYEIKKRQPEKPFIILIGGMEELKKFSIEVTEEQEEKLKEYWAFARPTSIILDCLEEKFAYLHRGTYTLAFRMPASNELRNLLKKTGPLIAPSANPEGLPPAKNIAEAKEYFGEAVDAYFDGGDIEGQASKIIKLNKDGTVTIIRE